MTRLADRGRAEGVSDWRLPYRSMDAGGTAESASRVAREWIDAVAIEEQRLDPTELFIETPGRGGETLVIALYRSTKLVACATVFRDPMNFSVLIRWRSPTNERPSHD